MNERIRQIRKENNMTQQEFADSLDTSRNNVAGWETGTRAPSAAALSLICKVHNVNETWLRTGEGEMFLPKTMNEELSAFLGDLIIDQSNGFKKRLVSALVKLRPEQWDLLEEIIDTVNDMKKE